MFVNVNVFIFISSLVFFTGLAGIMFNRKNVLIVLISIEISLLAVNLNFLFYSSFIDDLVGQVFSLFILTVAAAESAVGLAVLVCYYRIHSSISISTINLLQGLSLISSKVL